METPQNNNEQDKRIEFLKKEEMGMDKTDADNAGDESFTPIYLTSDTTLQTPGEKKHDESVDVRKDTTVEASEDDLNDTAFDRLNNEENTNEEE